MSTLSTVRKRRTDQVQVRRVAADPGKCHTHVTFSRIRPSFNAVKSFTFASAFGKMVTNCLSFFDGVRTAAAAAAAASSRDVRDLGKGWPRVGALALRLGLVGLGGAGAL